MNYFLTGVFLLACSYALVRGHSMYEAFRDRDMTLIDRVLRGPLPQPPILFKLLVVIAFFGGCALIVLSLALFIARFLP